MKHYGDITKLNGAELPVVDIITGGSPCQDLSVAGKRAGLAGERSGLFMEQIRLIREMREADVLRGRTDQLIRPRYCVWENVPGALSSNGGRDFQAVLTEFIRIAAPDAPDVPLPENGKWPAWGGYMGTGRNGRWSVAYRIHDAQYWGVPQRRRRICVLADFGGWTAHHVLFDPECGGEAEDSRLDEAEPNSGGESRPEIQPVGESLSGHPEPCGTAWEGAATGTESGADGTGAGGVDCDPLCKPSLSFQERAGKPGGGQRHPLTVGQSGSAQHRQ